MKFKLPVCCSKIKKKLIISFKSRVKRAWDILTLALSIFNAFMIPYELSYGSFLNLDIIIERLDLMIDIVFFIDFILMFFTTQQDNRGYEIKSHSAIAVLYVKSWRFKFDVLALLGINFISQIHPLLKIFQLFKATRVFRMGKVINNSQMNAVNKAIANIFKLVMFLFLYLHWVGCLMLMVVQINAPQKIQIKLAEDELLTEEDLPPDFKH